MNIRKVCCIPGFSLTLELCRYAHAHAPFFYFILIMRLTLFPCRCTTSLIIHQPFLKEMVWTLLFSLEVKKEE